MFQALVWLHTPGVASLMQKNYEIKFLGIPRCAVLEQL